jgi:HAD superfamily (subfamily IA) hydrolase, TIGR02254
LNLFKPYDHLFFDLDNTLWDFERNSKDSLWFIFKELNINQDFEEFFQYFEMVNNQLWGEYQKGVMKQKEVIVKRFELAFDKFNIHADANEINERFIKYLPTCTALKPNTIETLDYLKNKGYHLYIISNGIKNIQLKKIENSGLSPFFDKIFTSEEIGIPKPDKRIFRHALIKANARKIRSIVIGDSWESDIKGAHNVKMKSVFITWGKPTLENHPSTIIIEDLIQMQKIF